MIKNDNALAGCCVNGVSETHRVLPLCVFPLSLSVCLCAGVSQRESQVAQSPLASLGALWLSPARSPGLECLVPAGALPPLPRLLPLHFSLSPPPSFPPSPLPCDSLWAVQKPNALIYLFSGLAGGGCAARRWRLGGARTPGLNISRAGCGGGWIAVRERTLQHYPPTPLKKREGSGQAPCPEESGRGAPRSSAPEPRRGRLRTVGRRVRPRRSWDAARRRQRASLPTPAALSGSGEAACTAERGGTGGRD